MNRQKKIFLLFAALFIIGVGIVAYDINSRTSAPWEKGNLRTRISNEYGGDTGQAPDTADSTNTQNND